MRKNFSEKFYIESNRAFGKKIGSVLLAAVLILVMITGCSSKEEEVIEDTSVDIMQELPKDTVNTVDDGVSAAIATDEVEIMTSNKAEPGMVTMSVENVGRKDPFMPTGAGSSLSVSEYDTSGTLMPPPQSITVDTTATEVIGTKVSGIMFDAFNPSAIINISGSDYLVRTGDVINGYKVLAIARDVVTVQNGANIYKAGVGELFTGEGIKHNTVSNLEAKFGGRNNAVNMEKF